EGQGAGLLREGISAQAVSLQIFIVELQRETGTQRLEQVTRRPVNQVALAAMDERDHAAMQSISPGGSRPRLAQRRGRSSPPYRNRSRWWPRPYASREERVPMHRGRQVTTDTLRPR